MAGNLFSPSSARQHSFFCLFGNIIIKDESRETPRTDGLHALTNNII